MEPNRRLIVLPGAEPFDLSTEPYPAGVVPIWVSHYDEEQVIARVAAMPSCIGNMAFGVETPWGWRVVRHGDWIMTAADGGRNVLPAAFAEEVSDDE